VIVRKPKKKYGRRSVRENRYYFGVIIKLSCEYTGFSRIEMHNVFKGMFLKRTIESKGKTFEIVMKSKELSTVEFEDYLSKIRMYMSSEHNVYLPLPNEVDYETLSTAYV
jgi:hypothetical protein